MMSAQLTGLQLGGLLKQRRYKAKFGQSANAISLDGGASWWEFYLEEKEFAIGGPIKHTQPACDEWNPTHSGIAYSVIEVNPDSENSLLLVRFGNPEGRCFVFRVRTRPIQLVSVDAEGERREVGVGQDQTLDVIEFIGRVEDVLPDWREQPHQVLR